MARRSCLPTATDALLMALLAVSLLAIGMIVVVGFSTQHRSGAGGPTDSVPPLPAYRLTLSEDGAQVHLSGRIDFGITADLEALLDHAPAVKTLTLASGGGRVAEGRGLIRLVTKHRLATEAHDACLSICALVFMAGHTRRVAPRGLLGFHSYDLRQPILRMYMDVGAEQARDMALFRERGIHEDFLARIADTPPTEMWYPSRRDLRAAGVLTASRPVR